MELRSVSFVYICMFLNWLSELHDFYSLKLHATLDFIYKISAAEKRSQPEKDIDSGHEPVLLPGDVEIVFEKLGFICSSGEKFDEMANLFDENEPSIDEVKQAFGVFDENCDGYIDEYELKKVLERLGFQGLCTTECQRMIAAYDFNGDHKIDLADFFRIVQDSFC
ncbi:hypothetical protein ACET3Z_017333 [Daucus carota]